MTLRITWWGHATATIELDGVRFLTDPVLTRRLAHLHRIDGAPPTGAVTIADVVVVSHLHADHLHLPSLRRIDGDATLVVPAGAAAIAARAWSAPIREIEVGRTLRFRDITVTAVPALHDARRFPGSRHRAEAIGYLIEHADMRIWFAGDTGWFDKVADLSPVDVALVPVGGWGPTLGPHHLGPEEAARAVAAAGAAHAVPIHYGTFWPVGLRRLAPTVFTNRFQLPAHRFAVAVRRMDLPIEVHLLTCGETVELDRAHG